MVSKLGGFDNRSGTDAAGTHADMDRITTLACGSHLLKIRQPASSGLVMGVTYIVTRDRALSAYFADFSHLSTPYENEIVVLFKSVFIPFLFPYGKYFSGQRWRLCIDTAGLAW